MTIKNFSQFSTRIAGTCLAGHGSPRELTIFRPPVLDPDTVLAPCFRTHPIGAHALREPVDTGVPISVSPAPPGSGVVFRTGQGVLLGSEFTNVRRPNLISLEWSFSHVAGGCREARIELRGLPSFSLRNFMLIRIALFERTVWTGYARAADVSGTTRDTLTIRATGLYRQLEDVHEDVTVSGPVDLGVVARDLFLSVQNQTAIGYSAEKVNVNTLVSSAGDIELNRASWSDVMGALAAASDHQWGVDVEGDFYFLPRLSDVQQTYIVGWQVQEFAPERSFEHTANSVLVKRSTGKASGGAGWIVASVGEDLESIRDNGLFRKEYEMPGYFGDDVADALRDAILSRNSQPRWRGELREIRVREEKDLVTRRGPIRVIGPVQQNRDVVRTFESLAGIILVNTSGNTSISLDTSIVVAGAASLKIESVGGSAGDYIYFDVAPERRGFFDRVVWKLYSTLAGDILEFGAGRFSWTDDQTVVGAPVTVSWFDASQPTTERRIGQLGLRILTGSAFTCYIDDVELVLIERPHHVIEIAETRYKLDENGVLLDLDLGPAASGLETQIAGVMDLAKSTNAMLEIRT